MGLVRGLYDRVAGGYDWLGGYMIGTHADMIGWKAI